MFFYIQAATALILILAANTAFNGFPLLGSILAQDRYLPRQLHTRGDRLAFSNGIILLALIAGGLIYAFDGSITRLIQLYILGRVHLLHPVPDRHGAALESRTAPRRAPAQNGCRIHRARAINAFGACFTGVVLVVVMVTKFTHGAYLVVIAIPLLCVLMQSHPPALRGGARPSCAPASTTSTPAQQGPRNRAGIRLAQSHTACAHVRPGEQARHPHRAHRQRR